MDMHKEGTFKYGGRDGAADALFPSGECAIIHASSGLRARIVKEAKFQWGVAMLPYYKGPRAAPKNGIHRGRQPLVMTSPKRTAEEYKRGGVLQLHQPPEVDAKWHMDTGYVPITSGRIRPRLRARLLHQEPGSGCPFRQLTLTEPTENSMGLRLGNMPEIRVIIQEEMEKAFQGQARRQAGAG